MFRIDNYMLLGFIPSLRYNLRTELVKEYSSDVAYEKTQQGWRVGSAVGSECIIVLPRQLTAPVILAPRGSGASGLCRHPHTYSQRDIHKYT